MKFLHLSDTHLLHTKEIAHKTHAYQNVPQLTGQLEKLTQLEDLSEIDFIVVTGDMIYEGTDQDYAFLFGVFNEHFGDIPLYVTLGNHDNRTAFFTYSQPEIENKERYLDYDIITEDYHLVFLDTSETGKHGGELQASQIDWLEETLSTNDLPKLIFSHHPLLVDNDDFSFEENNYMDILDQHEIVGLFAGHIHYSSLTNNGGYLSHTVESTCFGLTIDAEETLYFNNRTGYSVVHVDQKKVSIEPKLLFPEPEVKKVSSYALLKQQIGE